MLPFSCNFLQQSEKNIEQESFIKNTPVDNFFLRFKGKDINITKREKDCLSLLAKGLRPQAIADELKIAKKTVDEHLEHLRKKMGVGSSSDLVLIYHKNGY